MLGLRKLLFESEAVNGIKSPNDYLYIKILRAQLSFLISWPYDELGEYESKPMLLLKRMYYFFVVTFCFISCVIYLFIHTKYLAFFELGLMYITLFMTVVVASRIFTLTFSSEYRRFAAYYLKEYHLFFYKDRSEYSMKIHKQVHQISHLFTMYLNIQVFGGIIFFNFTPMYSNYSAGKYKGIDLVNATFEHSLYYSYPFNTSTNLNGYIFACIMNWYFCYLCSSWVGLFDLLLSLMVFTLWGHFKILLHHLYTFPRPSLQRSCNMTIDSNNVIVTDEIYSEDELIHVFEKLKECIDYHRDIIKFTDRMSTIFGPMLFVYYVFYQIGGCLLLLECSQTSTESLLRYVPLTIILFQQLIQISIVFELVGSTSEKLKDAVYGLPWECMDLKNKRIVGFFLMNVQEPMHVKALGVANVGVTSMTAIIKTSLSYFTFLRSI